MSQLFFKKLEATYNCKMDYIFNDSSIFLEKNNILYIIIKMSSFFDFRKAKYFYNGNNDYYKKINSHTLKKNIKNRIL